MNRRVPLNPRIVFCVTCKHRAGHLAQTLPANIADNAGYGNHKFVVLDYNSRKDNLAAYLRTKHAADIAGGRLAVYRFTEPTSFRMAHAKNMAHRLGIREGADVLVNLDADNYTGPGFASAIAKVFNGHADAFMRPLKGSEVRGGAYIGGVPNGAHGRIAIAASAFLEAGGYNERYAKWSPDDEDFFCRLRRMGFKPVNIPREHLTVIAHDDETRFEQYPDVQPTWQQWHEVHAAKDTVVNYGRFGCGVVYRNFEPEPIELLPMPTRIFGIGLHRTATFALHRALQILGYHSAHWESPLWAKRVWNEMRTLGVSRTLEGHYALSDLPIPLLYEAIDKSYPGSKFILTFRDESAWLDSMRRHWSFSHNPWRKDWATDGFSDTIHLAAMDGRISTRKPSSRGTGSTMPMYGSTLPDVRTTFC
jgi:hypothetical protein